MTIRNKAGGLALGLAVALGLGSLPTSAQDPGPKVIVVEKKAEPAASPRVPDYFGKIGLTGEQRSTIYAIRARRQEKIDALEKQILDEKAAMMVECEAVLTETQKKLLENLRQAAASAKPAAGTPPARPAGTPKGGN